MTYEKIIPGEIFNLGEPKYIGDLKEYLKQEKMCEVNRNGDLFPEEDPIESIEKEQKDDC